jgi:hypothetical protein
MFGEEARRDQQGRGQRVETRPIASVCLVSFVLGAYILRPRIDMTRMTTTRIRTMVPAPMYMGCLLLLWTGHREAAR